MEFNKMRRDDEFLDRLKYRIEVTENRTFYYNHEGELHREGGPAVIWTNGDRAWMVNGKLHREGGPAVEWHNGHQEWYLNGVQQDAPRE